MTSTHAKRIVLLLLVLVTLLAVSETVQACRCLDGDNSLLGKFESSRFVVVVRVISVNIKPDVQTVYSGSEVIHEPITTVTSVTTIVEKVYKGNLKVGEQMIFGPGDNSDCQEEFDEDWAGARVLFYLNPNEKRPKLWHANMCDRTKPLPNNSTNLIEDAANDLLYLDKMNEVRGKTRISGTLSSYQSAIVKGGVEFTKAAGRKVQIVGNGKTYEALTNEDGEYEIYDLPAGNYAIKPEGKQGWEIYEDAPFAGFASNKYNRDGSAQVFLNARRHARSDFLFKIDNRLSGKVLDASGKPFPRVCLNLLPTQPNIHEDFERSACTENDGSFQIEEIPFASYVIVVNDEDKISPSQPFRRFYYPDVTDREKAQVITIVEGEVEYPLEIHVPSARELVTITGKVLTANDKPVVFGRVFFTADKTDPAIEGTELVTTDEQGNFSLNILKGLPGELSAFATLDPKEFKKCPAVLRVNDEINLERKTAAVRVQADRRLEGFDFKFEFSSCNREKIHSQLRID